MSIDILNSTELTQPMLNSYGLSTFRSKILSAFPQATFKFLNHNDLIYAQVRYKHATVHINHHKYYGGTDFDYEFYNVADYSEYDYVNPICIGCVSKVIDSMISHVLNYFKRF